MSFRYQLLDARNDSEIRDVSGVCNDSDKFRDQVNAVSRQLIKRGYWFGTDVTIQMCVQGCDITLPRYVHSALGVAACGAQIPVKNNWWEIARSASCQDGYSGASTMFDLGQFPCYNEVTGVAGKYIAYHVTKAADVGKTITIYGTAYGGQPLQEKDSNGDWRDGLTITAISGGGTSIAKTTVLATKITKVVREATQGMAYLYEWDGTNLRDLAVYEPNETNPQYRRYRFDGIRSIPHYTDSYGRTMRRVNVLVKLEFIPAINDYDFLIMDDFDALRYGIQALKNDNAGNPNEAEPFWTKAIRELNMLERSRRGGETTVAKVRVIGSSRVIANQY